MYDEPSSTMFVLSCDDQVSMIYSYVQQNFSRTVTTFECFSLTLLKRWPLLIALTSDTYPGKWIDVAAHLRGIRPAPPTKKTT